MAKITKSKFSTADMLGPVPDGYIVDGYITKDMNIVATKAKEIVDKFSDIDGDITNTSKTPEDLKLVKIDSSIYGDAAIPKLYPKVLENIKVSVPVPTSIKGSSGPLDVCAEDDVDMSGFDKRLYAPNGALIVGVLGNIKCMMQFESIEDPIGSNYITMVETYLPIGAAKCKYDSKGFIIYVDAANKEWSAEEITNHNNNRRKIYIQSMQAKIDTLKAKKQQKEQEENQSFKSMLILG